MAKGENLWPKAAEFHLKAIYINAKKKKRHAA